MVKLAKFRTGFASTAIPVLDDAVSPTSDTAIRTPGLARARGGAQAALPEARLPSAGERPRKLVKLAKRPLPPTTDEVRLRLLRARQSDMVGRFSDGALDAARANALAAVKLRAAAELHCDKDETARLRPRFAQAGPGDASVEALLERDLDALLNEVEQDPQRFSRSLLTSVASVRLWQAFQVDQPRYERGIRHAAAYEGLHSVAGRFVSAAGSAASFGAGALGASMAVREAARFVGHQAPANVVNPLVTGMLRTTTDVKESFLREGGQPQVASVISSAPAMNALAGKIDEQRAKLADCIVELRDALRADRDADHAVLHKSVDAFLDLYDLAQDQYKRRIGLNRTQTYSKGWGAVVNGVTSAAGVVSSAVPGIGPVIGLSILGASIPLQWGAGYLDEHTKHLYAHRANVKWGDLLEPTARRFNFRDLKPEHISKGNYSALRGE
jgi:hypothetical protein